MEKKSRMVDASNSKACDCKDVHPEVLCKTCGKIMCSPCSLKHYEEGHTDLVFLKQLVEMHTKEEEQLAQFYEQVKGKIKKDREELHAHLRCIVEKEAKEALFFKSLVEKLNWISLKLQIL